MWLLNKDEEITHKLTLISAIHTEVINAENTITFECVEVVNKMDRVIYRDQLNKYHEFIVQDVVESKHSNVVYAEHSAYEMHGDFVEDKKPTGTALTHLQAIMGNVRWEIGVVEGTTSLSKTYYRQSVYKSINDICYLFDVYRNFEIVVQDGKIVKRLINIRRDVGYDEGKRFAYSKDLRGVTRTILQGDVVTALYGFGKGEAIGDGYGRRINFGDLDKPDSAIGEMYVRDEDARREWGRNSPNGKQHVYSSYEFDDIEDIEELYLATKTKLAELSKPRLNYTADVVLLEDQHENVSVGDTVAIIDNDFRGRELRLKGKVIKIERDLLDGRNSVVEIGNYIDDLSDANDKLNRFVNDFRDKTGIWDKSNVFDKNGNLDSSFINDILEGWNDQMNGTSGFVYAVDGEGIITLDRAIEDNPTKAIQIIGGGWRIANSKKPNGDWDWRTLGTGDGIFGDQIIANTITVNQLSSDVGGSLDLSSNESINSIVQYAGTENIADNLNGEREDYKDWQSFATSESLLVFDGLMSRKGLTNYTTFEPLETNSLAGTKISFFANGQEMYGPKRIINDYSYSYNSKRLTGKQPRTLEIHEYDQFKVYLRKKVYHFDGSSQEEIIENIQFNPDVFFIGLMHIHDTGISIENRLEITDAMFAIGAPKTYSPNIKDWTNSIFEQLSDKMVLSVNNDDSLVLVELGVNPDDGSHFNVKADNIHLEGLITVDGNFKVFEDGSIEVNKGTFKGEVNTKEKVRVGTYLSMPLIEVKNVSEMAQMKHNGHGGIFWGDFDRPMDSLTSIVSYYLDHETLDITESRLHITSGRITNYADIIELRTLGDSGDGFRIDMSEEHASITGGKNFNSIDVDHNQIRLVVGNNSKLVFQIDSSNSGEIYLDNNGYVRWR